MQADDYRNLLRHMEWADARTWNCVLNLPALEGDGWIRNCLHHYHSTQWAYGQNLLKLPVVVPELSSLPDRRSVGCWAHRFYKELSAKLIAFDEQDFRRTMESPWSELVAEKYGRAHPATIGESIVQLALHSTHHRGQIVAHIRKAGGEPPVTDFIAWVWVGKPAAEWKLVQPREEK